MYDILQRKNKVLSDQAVTFAGKLVQQSSMSLGEEKVADLVQAKMEELGYENIFRDEFGNVVGMIIGREDGPTVLLNCHMDTVPVGSEDAWEDNPFSGKVEAGKLFGRGASDCKGGLAAQIYAGALLKRCLLPLKGNLIVAATVGEEQGSSVGVRGLMDKTLGDAGFEVDYAILGEPTELGLYYGHDGWMELEVKVEGENMFDVDDAAKAIFSDFKSRASQRQDAAGREDIDTDPPRYELVDGVRSATIGMMRRLNEAEEVSDVLNQVEHDATMAANGAGQVAVKVQVRQEKRQFYTGTQTIVQRVTNAWAIDPYHFLMERARQSLAAAGCEVRTGKWQLGRLGMGTAGSVLTKDYSIPAIGYGPGNEESSHGANEYVAVEKVKEAIYGTAAIVHSLIGIPVFGWTSDDI